MADMSESLFQAIDTIVNKRLQAINFDNTDIYSITDASKAELGEYKVTDGSVTFTAYSTNTNYKVNEAVYVTIPNNDFNQQKLIIGKYTADSETPFVFINPTSTMIDVTGNIINGEIQEAGLTANSVNTEDWPNEEEILMWQLDCHNKNYIGFERLGIKGDFKSWLKDFDCVRGHYGLKVKIYCLNNDTYSNRTFYELVRDKCYSDEEADINWVLNTSQITNSVDVSSAQDDAEKIDIILDYINNKLAELLVSYELKLDSNDMIGDAFNFTSYHRQEQVFDISNLGQIIKIELWFYQDKNSFYDIFGEQIPYLDSFSGGILPRNLFIIDPYIMLGYDLNNFNGEQAILTSTDSLTYKQQDSIDSITTEEDIYNKKYIHLAWLHESNRGIVNIENDTDVDGIYYINWYQRSAGAASPDEWAGVEWIHLTQDGEGNTLGPHTFNYTLTIDEDSYNKPYEQIKAIIVYTSSTGNTTAIRSNIITFSNEADVINSATIDQTRGLTIRCLDGTEGNYYIYRQDYNLIDRSDSNRLRTLQCELYSDEFGLEGIIQEAKSVTWRIPASNTMLRVASGTFGLSDFDYTHVGGQDEVEYYADILYDSNNPPTIDSINSFTDCYKDDIKFVSCKTTGYLYDPENKEIVITWFGNENLAYAINPYLQYTISGFYAQNNTNNKVICEINKNNRDYVGDKEFSFGTAGTNGAAYTLVIDMYHIDNNYDIVNQDTAITAGQDMTVAFNATLYDTKGQKVDLYNSENFEKLQFTWGLYKGNYTVGTVIHDTHNMTEVNINTSVDYNFMKYDWGAANETKKYYETSTPDNFYLTFENQTLNGLYYIYCTLSGWGNYDLTTVFPIAIRKNTEEQNAAYEKYLHINGPDRICYPSSGYPEFYNNPFHIYVGRFNEDNQLISRDIQLDNYDVESDTGEIVWTIYNPHNENINYLPVISDKSILQPLSFYVDNQLPYGIKASRYDEDLEDWVEIWTQPIWTYQNDYFSQALNDWDGKEIQIDDDNGTIITRGVAAGKKENDNSFTGVVIGDWSAAAGGNNSNDISRNTGVYGFDHGAMSYAFKDDGSAFIGKSGKGRILFDGNESTITSENYNVVNGGGILIDLDDGYQKFVNNKSQYGKITVHDEAEFTRLKNILFVQSNGEYVPVGNNDIYDEEINYYQYSENYFVTLDARTNNLRYDDHAIEIGTSGSANFYVQWDGTIYAKDGLFEGRIEGSTININNNFTVDAEGNISAGGNADFLGTTRITNLQMYGGSVSITQDSSLDAVLDLGQSGQIQGGTLIGNVIEDPDINLYTGTHSADKKILRNILITSMSIYDSIANTTGVNIVEICGSYTTGGRPYTFNVSYPSRTQVSYYLNRPSSRVILLYTETWQGESTGGRRNIKFYHGSPTGTDQTLAGYIGYTGMSDNDDPVVGIDMSNSGRRTGYTGDVYGISFTSGQGGIIGLTDNFYAKGKSDSAFFQILYNSGTPKAKMTNGSWTIELGTSPLLNNTYDLRYAYFA